MKRKHSINVRKARLYYPTGEVEHFRNQVFALAVWLGLPRGMRVAFRAANDPRPVHPWDYVDKL